METTSYRDQKTAVAGDLFLDDLADGESCLRLTLGGCLLEFLSLRPHSRLASFLQERFLLRRMLGVVQPLVLRFCVHYFFVERDSFRWYYVM